MFNTDGCEILQEDITEKGKKNILDDTYIQHFNCAGRFFFYILGNLVGKKDTKKPSLVVYEYFMDSQADKASRE